jgi:16S rRNA processing protein RimM
MVAENCQLIGKFSKLHGFEGEALLVANEGLPKKFEKTEWMFFILEGLPVPFFVSYIKLRTETSAIVKLADVDTSEEMKKLIGLEVLVETPKNNKKTNQGKPFNIEGYGVIDSKHGKIGIAKTVLNFQENYLLQIFNNKREILIPVNEFNIGEINDNQKTIQVDIPEGLLELNT